jgi:hypothetical protein
VASREDIGGLLVAASGMVVCWRSAQVAGTLLKNAAGQVVAIHPVVVSSRGTLAGRHQSQQATVTN